MSRPSASILERIVAWIESAGTPTEEATDRDGFLSHKAETHALAMGISAGWYYGAVGDTKLLSLVYAAAVYGRSHESSGQRRRLFRDIIEEPHYALAGIVVGAVIGGSTSILTDLMGVA